MRSAKWRSSALAWSRAAMAASETSRQSSASVFELARAKSREEPRVGRTLADVEDAVGARLAQGLVVEHVVQEVEALVRLGDELALLRRHDLAQARELGREDVDDGLVRRRDVRAVAGRCRGGTERESAAAQRQRIAGERATHDTSSWAARHEEAVDEDRRWPAAAAAASHPADPAAAAEVAQEDAAAAAAADRWASGEAAAGPGPAAAAVEAARSRSGRPSAGSSPAAAAHRAAGS